MTEWPDGQGVVTRPFENDPEVVARKTLLEWLVAHLNEEGAAGPSPLWHYTDASGLKGIVTSDRLWATDTRFLNDSSEISYGLALAADALAKYDTSKLKSTTRNFIEGLSDPLRGVLAGYFERTLEVFVTCFCVDGDLLSQWRAYTGRDAAGGYAIGFAPRGPAPAWAQVAPGGHLVLRSVVYDPARQEALCQDLITRLVAWFDSDPDDLDFQKAFGKNLIDGLVEIATWCKHPNFAEEHEWRIVYVRSADPKPLPVLHRTSDGLVIPYVELELPATVGDNPDRMPIALVKCGPSSDPALKRLGVRSLLDASLKHKSARVESSDTPLRH